MLIDQEFNVTEALLLHKKTPHLDKKSIEEIVRIQNLDTKRFNEVDVRAEIIDPILRILGYRKGNFSSVDRERHIKFLGKTNKYIDYSLTIWEENFWIIEAKRPLPGENFGYEELRQAIEYSIHPQINAAIILLCDGLKFEIFDREENVETPIISFKRDSLAENFDSLRKILDPMSIWYFYKRRILRSIDKVFESEFNQARVNEFQEIVERRLTSKRSKILENFQRAQLEDRDPASELRLASLDEIVEIHFFYDHSKPSLLAMHEALSDIYIKNQYLVIEKIFPHDYRYRNDCFHINSLSFLIYIENHSQTCNHLPLWLDPQKTKSISSAIENLIQLCLTNFRNDEARKIILLTANTYKRIFKILSATSPAHHKAAHTQHLLTRFDLDEFSWGQIFSSPKRNLLFSLDAMTMNATCKFVNDFCSRNGCEFKNNLAQLQLKELWNTEISLLQSIPNYQEILQEIDLGEIFPCEYSSTIYDELGHRCLCIVARSESWKKHVLENHLDDILYLNSVGSWSARKLLTDHNISHHSNTPQLHQSIERFFFGAHDIRKALYNSYQFKFDDN